MADGHPGRDQIEQSVQECYSTWGTSYHEDYYGPKAPYPPVHVDLLRRIVRESGARTVLDAGCGPASFLRYLAEDGFDLYGFDLTEEMVFEGKRVFQERGLDPDRVWQGSVLDPSAFSGPGTRAIQYDAALCVGVLPHVSPEEENRLLSNLHVAVRPGGLAIVEARNQLFSLFTMNRPSYEFIRDHLIRADELVAASAEDANYVHAGLEGLKSRFRMDLPPIRRGKLGEPGYDEVLSRTHNPLVLRQQFESAGFRDVQVLFYHFHALPPMLSAGNPSLFLKQSLAMEEAEDWRGYFMASAFLLCGLRV